MRVCIIALLLAACGGGQEPGETSFRWSEPLTMESIFGPTSPVMTAARQRAEAARAGAAAPAPVAAAAEEQAVLTMQDEHGREAAGFELRPVRGKGFPELTIVVRGVRAGEAGPPVPLRPVCMSPERCEYRLGSTYVLALSSGSNLQLVARGDAAVLVARALSVDGPQATELLLTQRTRVLARRQVVLLSEAAAPS